MCTTPPSLCRMKRQKTHRCHISSYRSTTKDSSYEGLTDTVTIGIEIAAETRPQLAALAIMVRQTIAAYFAEHVQDVQDEDYELIPNAYTISAQGVQYDSLKPCFWQRLSYQCDTNPDE